MHPFLSDDELHRIEATFVERVYVAEREFRLQMAGKLPAPADVSERAAALLERADKRRLSER